MSYILSIETSTKVCSVALHQNHTLLALTEVMVEKSHSKVITTNIENILKNCNLKFDQLNAIAVSKGPGSYTGLRIGVSTAKGLCYGLNIPLIGVNTLEAMALEANSFNFSNALVCPMLDARRMEVYCAIFDKKNNFVYPTQAKVIEEDTFKEVLENQQLIFLGDGAAKTKNVFSKYKNAQFIDNIFPSAKNIGHLAVKAFENKQFEDVVYFEPYYLKDFISTGKMS